MNQAARQHSTANLRKPSLSQVDPRPQVTALCSGTCDLRHLMSKVAPGAVYDTSAGAVQIRTNAQRLRVRKKARNRRSIRNASLVHKRQGTT